MVYSVLYLEMFLPPPPAAPQTQKTQRGRGGTHFLTISVRTLWL